VDQGEVGGIIILAECASLVSGAVGVKDVVASGRTGQGVGGNVGIEVAGVADKEWADVGGVKQVVFKSPYTIIYLRRFDGAADEQVVVEILRGISPFRVTDVRGDAPEKTIGHPGIRPVVVKLAVVKLAILKTKG